MTDIELQERAEWLYKEHGEKCIEFLDWELSPPSHKGGPLPQRFEKLGSDIDQVCQGFSMNWKRIIFHAALLAAQHEVVSKCMNGVPAICSAHQMPNAACDTCNPAIREARADERGMIQSALADVKEEATLKERERWEKIIEDELSRIKSCSCVQCEEIRIVLNHVLTKAEKFNAIHNPPAGDNAK